MQESREIDIDLRKIIYMMRTKVIYILLITIAFGAASALYTHLFIDPVYEARCSMIVNNTMRTTEAAISTSEINASADLVATYIRVLKSDAVLDKVAQELKLGSGDAIRGNISAAQDGTTFMFTIRITSTDPQRAADIGNAICKVAPAEMQKVTKAGGVTVVDTAKLPHSPTSPNVKKNILMGLAIGFVLSFVAFFVYEMFDTSITNTNDLTREFSIPVLGTVPMLDEVERGGSEEGESTEEEIAPPAPSVSKAKPSAELLENIQSMKGDSKND